MVNYIDDISCAVKSKEEIEVITNKIMFGEASGIVLNSQKPKIIVLQKNLNYVMT